MRNIQTDSLRVLLLERKSWMSYKSSTIDCIFTTQVQWNTKRLFNSNTRIFSRSWVEKNDFLLEKIELFCEYCHKLHLQWFIKNIINRKISLKIPAKSFEKVYSTLNFMTWFIKNCLVPPKSSKEKNQIQSLCKNKSKKCTSTWLRQQPRPSSVEFLSYVTSNEFQSTKKQADTFFD